MMKQLIINLFGTYTPVITSDIEGNPIIAEGIASLDVPYILGVLLFAICLSAFFKILCAFIRG